MRTLTTRGKGARRPGTRLRGRRLGPRPVVRTGTWRTSPARPGVRRDQCATVAIRPRKFAHGHADSVPGRGGSRGGADDRERIPTGQRRAAPAGHGAGFAQRGHSRPSRSCPPQRQAIRALPDPRKATRSRTHRTPRCDRDRSVRNGDTHPAVRRDQLGARDPRYRPARQRRSIPGAGWSGCDALSLCRGARRR